jgi:hypothetical protein
VPRAESPALGTRVGPTSGRGHPTPRLCREQPTGSRQIFLLCRELFPWLSAQGWDPQLTPSAVNGPVTRAKWALSTTVPRVWPLAHDRAAFAGPAVPRALCWEFPLGTGCAQSNQAYAERIVLSAQARIPVVVHPLRVMNALISRKASQGVNERRMVGVYEENMQYHHMGPYIVVKEPKLYWVKFNC